MDIKEIRELLELIRTSGIEEFEMEKAGVRLRIRNATQSQLDAAPVSNPSHEETLVVQNPLPAPLEETLPVEEDLYLFKAPIVGTFYITAKPDAAPFVQVGDRVNESTVLCIIEAMKIFNQIESDVSGEIIEVLVDNGQPVEFGEPLFKIRQSP